MNSKRLFIFIMLWLIISCELLDFTEGFIPSVRRCGKIFKRRCRKSRRQRHRNHRGPSKKGRGDLNPTNNWSTPVERQAEMPKLPERPPE